MEIIRKPTFKHFNSNNPVSVIFHIDLGTAEGTTDWILNGPKSVSYNYYITKEGVVIEFVPYDKGAWHSGVVFQPTPEAKSFYGSTNPNKKSIGICYEGREVNTEANEAQIKAGKELIEFIKSRGVKIKKYFIHKELTSYKPQVVATFRDAVVSGEEEVESPICRLLRTLMEKYGCKCVNQ